MRILITGARGLYGVHLIDLLVKKKNITTIFAVDNNSRRSLVKDPFIKSEEFKKKVQIMTMNYQDLDTHKINQLNCDIVIQLAAYVSIDESMVEPYEYFENNERGNFNLIQTLLATIKKPLLIYASSPEVYGDPQYVPMDEKHPLRPRSVYAATKLASEKHCMVMFEWYKYPVISVRNFNTFGENQNVWGYPAVIPLFIQKALKNEPLVIHDKGRQTRDFLYVKDAVRAYEAIIDSGHKYVGEEFNIGTGCQTSIKELAQLIIKLTGSKSKIEYAKGRTGDLSRLCADISKIKKAVDWQSEFTLEAGLKRTIRWFKEHAK